MRRNEHGALVLSVAEMTSLGMLIAARQLEAADDWMPWEDLPEMNARQHGQLIDIVQAQGRKLNDALNDFERLSNVDSRFVLEQAS